jgi:hypothetical protein
MQELTSRGAARSKTVEALRDSARRAVCAAEGGPEIDRRCQPILRTTIIGRGTAFVFEFLFVFRCVLVSGWAAALG